MRLWGDADIDAMRGTVAELAPTPVLDNAQTIGHIGRYALKYRLGEGGLGTVFAAHDPLLSRLIAVKTLNLEVEEDEREAFNALFLNEARAAAGLNHSHIVTVFDAGVSDDRAYIAMELLKGRDLRQLRQEGWRASPAQAALIVRRVADALGYAHSKGVVHRDVKPANIFMVGRTQPKVLDFGIARITHQHETAGDATAGDIAAGSPYYMAPEQVRHESVDRRADVFSLGVVLYEMLTDRKPFRGATLADIATAVLKHEPPLAHTVDPAVPEALSLITAKALQKNPDQRYRSARAFSRELRHWLDENTTAPDGDVPVVKKRTPTALWLGLAGAAAVAGAATLWLAVAPPHVASRKTSVAPAASAALPLAAAAPPVASAPTPTPAATPVSMAETTLPATTPDTAAAAPPAASAVAVALPARAGAIAPRAAVAKESPKDRRSREARERDARAAVAVVPAAILATGTVRIAISPWGNVEVDGQAAGTSPPLTELTLPEGRHQVVVRNADLPPLSVTVTVTAGQPVNLKHKF
jgi:serine/threonine-protein kinase